MPPSNRLKNTFFIGIFLSSVLFSPYILDFTLVTRFIVLALFVVLMSIFMKKQTEGSIKTELIGTTYVLYFLFVLSTIFWSENKSESLFESGKVFLSLSVFFFSYFLVKNKGDDFIGNLAKISLIIFVLEFATAYYQFLKTGTLTGDAKYAISGLNSHKNLFASFLFLSLFFQIYAARRFKDLWKVVAVICFLLNLLILALLKTKAVYVGLVLTTLVLGVVWLTAKIKALGKISPFVYTAIFVVVANIFFLFVLPSLITNAGKNTGAHSSSISAIDPERWTIWEKSYYLFHKSPVYGLGGGNWQVHFPDATLTGIWRAEDPNVTFQRPHNDFLWILSETGVIGFNLYVIFLCLIISFLLRAYIKEKRNEPLLLLAFICGFLAISFFDFPKERIEHLIWFHILLGLAYYYSLEHDRVYLPVSFGSAKNLGMTLIGFASFWLFLGLLRYKGEYYSRNMYDHKYKGENYKVIRAGQNALSFAYSIDPTSVPVHWYTGNAHAALGNYSDAHKHFQKALHFNPYNRHVLNDLGSSWVFAGDTTQAIRCYEESSRISPRYDEPKLNLAALYINKNDFEKANYWLHSLLHDSQRRSNYQRIVDAHKTQPVTH